ncbi:putative B6 ABC transporter permease subunit 1 [Roseibium aggregatum]|uniref:ABC transporter permease n=1 Tax=Roseibium aggregatum TaxID=187304 RepID=A0A939J7J6_9HYPH|nr:ABC transporter permease [Roseibium aggregatum]MBN9673904.1 ABC transporter permease [Roseibium aggregatum]
MALFTEAFLTALLAGAISAGIPLLLVGLGEQMSEKSGVLNIGIEGMMLAGAYTGFLIAWKTESMGLGFIAGAGGGMFVALFMAVLCVRMGLNQIVIGISLTLGAEGATAILHHFQFSRTYPRLPATLKWDIPVLHDIPVIGPALFGREPVVYFALILVAVFAYLYRRTHFGLALQAAGDKPAALDSSGVDVLKVRTVAVLTTGALAGLGGAFMAIVGAGIFVPFMTHGNGFIGIVLAMLARGRPLWVLGGATLFGACLSLTTALQVAGIDIPTDVIQMLPFAAVMAVLIVLGSKANLPVSLGTAYARGER